MSRTPIIRFWMDEEETDEEPTSEDDEANARLPFTVTPVDMAEATLAQQVNRFDVEAREPEYALGRFAVLSGWKLRKVDGFGE